MEALLDKRKEFLGKIILISDDQSSSDYFLHYFISQTLKDGHSLCLVSTTQDFTHYSTISSKLSCNLKLAQDRNQFHFIQTHSHSLTIPKPADHHGHTSYIIKNSSLKPLYELIKNTIEGFDSTKPACVIIDDLSILLSMGVALKEILIFSNYCRNLILTDTIKGYVLMRVHCDSDIIDEEENHLLLHITHNCHLHIHTCGLSTGYSRDISGEVIVERRGPMSQPETRTMQYKILDRGINLFPRGMSTVVL